MCMLQGGGGSAEGLLLGAAHLLAAAALLLVAAVVCFGALALGVLLPRAQLLLHVIHRPQCHLRQVAKCFSAHPLTNTMLSMSASGR